MQREFTWVATHHALTKYLRTMRNHQTVLIDILKSAGVDKFDDESAPDVRNLTLDEIDPFTFYCYIYKYRSTTKRLKILQQVAKLLHLPEPIDTLGVPSTQPLKVWLFPWKYQRSNEIDRLWDFFESMLDGELTNEQFMDVLSIYGVGRTKLTEVMFYAMPATYLPLNSPAISYIEDVFAINTSFNTLEEYNAIIDNLKLEANKSNQEISYDAFLWNKSSTPINYWIFQSNPNIFNLKNALNGGHVQTWRVSQHKNNIKKGDKVILWQTGNGSGCHALAEVKSNVGNHQVSAYQQRYYLGPIDEVSLTRVKLKVTTYFDNPMPIDRDNDIFQDFKAGNPGTNYSATKEQYEYFLDHAKPKLKYWLFAPGEGAEQWDSFYNQGIMALGWDYGDLGKLNKKQITAIAQSNGSGTMRNIAHINYEFAHEINVGDIVIVKKGRKQILGYGEVNSDYYYDEQTDAYRSRRQVEWKMKGAWPLSFSLAMKTLTNITKYAAKQDDQISLPEELMQIMTSKSSSTQQNNYQPPALNTIFYGPPGTGKTHHAIIRAAEIIAKKNIDSYDEALSIYRENLYDRIEFITFHQNYSYEDFIEGLRPNVEMEDQLIFKQQPGIFKSLVDRAKQNFDAARHPTSGKAKFLQALEAFKESFLTTDDTIELTDNVYLFDMEEDAFRYTGENWSRENPNFKGLRMKFSDLTTMYLHNVQTRQDIKRLKDVSGTARNHASYFIRVYQMILEHMPKRMDVSKSEPDNYVLIIDEINRANISRVFGELITLIEPSKRHGNKLAMSVRLPSGDKEFTIPANLYIIGTMNTADKSIALLDLALRRRFEFEAFYPVYDLPDHVIHDADILENINRQVIKERGHDFQIGHTYFMDDNVSLVERMNNQVIPLLSEYFMNDHDIVTKILYDAGLKLIENSYPLKTSGRRD